MIILIFTILSAVAMTLFDKSKISSEENWLANDCNTNNNKTSVSNEVENQWNEIFGETNREEWHKNILILLHLEEEIQSDLWLQNAK